MNQKVTCEDCVLELKRAGLSCKASQIAANLGTSSRAVATSLRKATQDGRVSIRHKANAAIYRFKRLTARTGAKA